MKLGISSYSLYKAMKNNEMTILEVMEWVAEQGAAHIEIVPSLGFDFDADPSLVDAIKSKAASLGLELSNYAVGGNFVGKSEAELEQEIAKVIAHVDIASRLGIKLMRHDVAWRPIEETSIRQFDIDLETIAGACRRIADYAAPLGITTSIENHGYHVQASERVQRLIHAVDRENFKTTMDVGNFLCADEDSVTAVKRNISFASMVHLKDFYVRPSNENPGDGWFKSQGGNYLRGAIVGHGDIRMGEVVRIIKSSGYDGYVSIEFEGMEDCRTGTKIGFDNALRFWNEA